MDIFIHTQKVFLNMCYLSVFVIDPVEVLLSKIVSHLMEVTHYYTRNDKNVMEQEPQSRLRGQSTLLGIMAFSMRGVYWG